MSEIELIIGMFAVAITIALWRTSYTCNFGGDNTAYVATISRLCADLEMANLRTNQAYRDGYIAGMNKGPGNPVKPADKDV